MLVWSRDYIKHHCNVTMRRRNGAISLPIASQHLSFECLFIGHANFNDVLGNCLFWLN